MIFWSGLGILAPVIAFVCAFVADLLVRPPYSGPNWARAVAFIMGAVVTWLIGQELNHRPGRVLIDKETRQEIILRQRHTLFFIPLQYWAIAMLLGAVMSGLRK